MTITETARMRELPKASHTLGNCSPAPLADP